jgi:hypothetical protein
VRRHARDCPLAALHAGRALATIAAVNATALIGHEVDVMDMLACVLDTVQWYSQPRLCGGSSSIPAADGDSAAGSDAHGIVQMYLLVIANTAASGQHASAVVANDGVRHICDAMEACAHVAGVQAVACRALAAIAAHAQHQACVASRECLRCVYAAMDGHVQSAEVQEFGCKALGNATADRADVGDAAATVLASGGLRRVFAAMDAHPAAETVQQHACRVIGTLSNSKFAKLSLAHKGLGTDVSRASVAGGDDPSSAGDSDSGTSSRSAASPILTIADGGIARVLRAMRAHAKHGEIHRHACKALAAFAHHADLYRILLAGDVEAAIATALALHGADPNVSKYALHAAALVDKARELLAAEV